MPSAKRTVTKSHCNDCLKLTEHDVIARLNREFPDYGDDGALRAVEYMQYDFVQCRGCKEVSLRRVWSATFTDDESVDYFPPPVSRARPKWLSGMRLIALSGPKHEIRELLNEVYSALSCDNRRIALMGVRTIIDIALTDKLGHDGTFAHKLDKAKAQQWITPTDHKVLTAAVEAGHAASHRAYKPDAKQLNLVLNIVEHLIQALYILERDADEIAMKTPPKAGKPVKGKTP